MVVLGNPPYSGLSANMSEGMAKLVDAYKMVDGQPLSERKHWLQDDYVKFIRFAQMRIEQTGYGVLAFISNHGYLDNPTFRGMRQSLMETFDDIYILDLHGNSKKKERAPDGSKDENVFDIQQGVAIGIFVKRASAKNKPANIRHAHLWGVREIYEEDTNGERVLSGGKYSWLWQHELSTTSWVTFQPQSPFYLFTPRLSGHASEYDQGWRVPDIMLINSAGIITARDGFITDIKDDALLKRIVDFGDLKTADEAIRAKYFTGKGAAKYEAGDSRGWKLPNARKAIAADKNYRAHLKKILYRPFDERWIYYTQTMVDWPRPEVMPHMLAGPNLGLSTTRST